MKIYSLEPLSFCATNSYIIETSGKNAILIDAPENADYILSQLNKYGLALKKILLTHGHFDHIGAVPDLYDKTSCEVYIHECDENMLKGGSENLSHSFLRVPCKRFDNFTCLKEGDEVTLDDVSLKVIHTPGHTRGSVCYILGDIIFTGDTLFCGSIGRTDFPGSSIKDMIKSLGRLRDMNGDYTLLCGHGEKTTLEIEKNNNIYIQGLCK